MPDIQQIEAVAAHKATYQHDLSLARTAFDRAVGEGSRDEVKSLQAEIATLEALIESCDRRIAKLQQETTEAEKQAQREANDSDAKAYRACAKRLVPQARKIMQAAATLAAELQVFHDVADQAGEHYRRLARQMTGHERETNLNFVGAANFRDGTLGVALSEELRKLGVFKALAPTALVEFRHYDLPPLDELIEIRIEKTTPRVDRIRERVNAAI